MFGYFRFNQLYATPKLKNVYKNYYCGTCFALEYNYSEMTRWILSYDVVILALIARLYDSPNKEILPCFFKKKEKLDFAKNKGWQKVAAINVLLMNAKFDDDINDEQSTKAKVAAIAFGKSINKAKKGFPELAEIIKDGYLEMYKLETTGGNIIDICNSFADMMEKLLKASFDVGEGKVKFVKGISRWLYFIDQLDDYDDDVKEGKYNPLVIEGISKRELIDKKHDYIFGILKEIFYDYEEIKASMDLNCSEDCLLYAVINESIPNVTSMILSDRKLPQLLHTKKDMEWKEVD